jgi:hypothetical protein
MNAQQGFWHTVAYRNNGKQRSLWKFLVAWWNFLMPITTTRPIPQIIALWVVTPIFVYRAISWAIFGVSRPYFWLIWKFRLPYLGVGQFPFWGWIFLIVMLLIVMSVCYVMARRSDVNNDIAASAISVFWGCWGVLGFVCFTNCTQPEILKYLGDLLWTIWATLVSVL